MELGALAVTEPSSGTPPPASVLRRAAASTLSGVLFAGFLASVLVALQVHGWRPMRLAEQTGIDIGMWLYANVGWFASAPDAPAANPMRLAFIDVDRGACEAFLDGERAEACRTDNPVRSALLVDLVRALRAAGAAVVVVDVAPPAAGAVRERQAWRDALVANDGPWVIAPLFARPSDECSDGLSIRGDRRHDIVPTHAAGRLRLASVATRLDAELADGVVRHYPLASRLLLEGEPPRWVPTVPMLAAVLARGGDIAEIDRLWYAPLDGPSTLQCGAAGSAAPSPSGLPSDTRFDAAAAGTPAVVRFFFSLPGLSTMDETQRRRVEQRHLPVYERYLASRLLEADCSHRLDAQATPQPGCFAVRKPLFEGKVVVIGSSSATALDRAQTPVGPMSGAEIIANATRAFAEFPALQTPDGWTMWRSKIGGLLVPAAITFVMWLLICRSGDLLGAREAASAAAGRPVRRWLLGTARETLAVVVFLAATLLAAWLELRNLMQDLAQVRSNAAPVEMLLPLLSMGLEGYAEFAKAVDEKFHRLATWGTARAVGLFGRRAVAARDAPTPYAPRAARRRHKRHKERQP
jgi:CHASE2 domain